MPGDVLIAYHESGHAVVASQFGFDVRHVQLHHGGGGCCEMRQWLAEVDNDPVACLVYLFAAGKAEARASGRPPSGTDAQDRLQALALASVVHDHADASDPRVVATLRATEALATATVQNPSTWAAIEKVACALKRRKYLSGRDVQEIIREGRR